MYWRNPTWVKVLQPVLYHCSVGSTVYENKQCLTFFNVAPRESMFQQEQAGVLEHWISLLFLTSVVVLKLMVTSSCTAVMTGGSSGGMWRAGGSEFGSEHWLFLCFYPGYSLSHIGWQCWQEHYGLEELVEEKQQQYSILLWLVLVLCFSSRPDFSLNIL